MCSKICRCWQLIFWHGTSPLWFLQLARSNLSLDIIKKKFWKWIAYMLGSYCTRQWVFPLCSNPCLVLLSAFTLKKQHSHFHFSTAQTACWVRAHCWLFSLCRDFCSLPVWISVASLNALFYLMSPLRSLFIFQFMFLCFIVAWRRSHAGKF